MVKAIFFDIDGTLVSFQTHTALRLLREKGIKVFIATGRPKTLMMDAVGDLDFDGYVTLNGAHCFTANHEDIYKGCVPQEDIERLIQYQHDHPEMPFVFVHDNTWFLTHEDEAVREIARLIQIDIPKTKRYSERCLLTVNPCDGIRSLPTSLHGETVKVTVSTRCWLTTELT